MSHGASATPVDTLVLPVAGMGTRLRPLTLTMPKALVLLRGKPLLDYMLSEAALSGIKNVVLVISPQHSAHFEEYLRTRRGMFPSLAFAVRIQSQAFGNGQALLMAADCLEGKPFAMRFCDDVLVSPEPPLRSMLRIFSARQAPLLLLKRIPCGLVPGRYGVMRTEPTDEAPLHRITALVEKPKEEQLKGFKECLANDGTFVFTAAVLENLKDAMPDAPAEIDGLLWTVGITKELARDNPVFGWEFPGEWLEVGNLQGLQEAEHALEMHEKRGSVPDWFPLGSDS